MSVDHEFIKLNYQDQIEALTHFYYDASMDVLPLESIKFGGGTALAMYYFQHRLSFDIDLFASDAQYLPYLSPKHWIEESEFFDASEYKDQMHHIALKSTNNIKVDILIDSNASNPYIDDTKLFFPFSLAVESVEDIIAKKIVFRKKDNKARDIFDIAIALEKVPDLLESLLEQGKISTDDLQVLKDSLLSIDIKKYLSHIEIVEPFEEYQSISKEAPQNIIDKLTELLSL